MSELLRSVEPLGTLHLKDVDWHFRVYLMRGDKNEVIERDILFENLRQKVHFVVSQYLSDEFVYIRTGFILAHYGRRGVTYSIWHWADWCGTWEYFCQAWYCYGRALSEMQPLDRTEPILCQHEIEIVTLEGKAFRGLAMDGLTNEQLILQYRSLNLCSA